MRTRTKGIQLATDGSRIVEKQYRGQRLFARLGKVSQEEAEQWLRQQQARIDAEFGKGLQHDFASAAERYLRECERRELRSIDSIAEHVNLIVPWIGNLPLEAIHTEVLEPFIDSRRAKVSPTTVNKTLRTVSSILLRAARVWRTSEGKPWLATAPLIETLEESPREPYPITWEEQARLFRELPAHLEQMCLFAVNTGARDENVCGLRWIWEERIPELNRSVFVIPSSEFKGKRPHVLILNDVAAKIVESCRGKHPEYVFTYKNELKSAPADRIGKMNNTAYQKARKRAHLEHVRVHDLRHTFAHRLRAAGVQDEDRDDLMGHAKSSMSRHYATATIAHLVEEANKVATTRDAVTLRRVVSEKVTQKVTQRKTA